MYDDYGDDGEGAHPASSAQDLPNGIVDVRVWKMCNREDATAELWQAVRSYMQARAGRLPLPPEELPPCLATFLSVRRLGQLFELMLAACRRRHRLMRRRGLADVAGGVPVHAPASTKDARTYTQVRDRALLRWRGITAALEQLGGVWAEGAQWS